MTSERTKQDGQSKIYQGSEQSHSIRSDMVQGPMDDDGPSTRSETTQGLVACSQEPATDPAEAVLAPDPLTNQQPSARFCQSMYT